MTKPGAPRFDRFATIHRAFGVGALIVGLAGCSSQPAPRPCPSPPPAASAVAPPNSDAPLACDPAFKADPATYAKLKKSPHHYFRAVNRPFALDVCRRFEGVMNTLPMVSLHGDPHLEQIAVMDSGAGFSDFDDSMSGPPVIDIVRFGTSVALAALQRGWDRKRAVEHFLTAYTNGVAGAEEGELPGSLVRLRQKGSSNEAFLAWAEGLMDTRLDRKNDREFKPTWGRYVALMTKVNKGMSASHFRIKRGGRVKSHGVGSALSKRILLRIEGTTDAPGDDQILEMKEVSRFPTNSCVETKGGMSIRIVANGPRFGAQFDPFLAVIPRGAEETLDDPPWWVQSWRARYAEVNIAESLASEQELHDVAAFAARVLARGHITSVPAPYDQHLRTIVGDMLTEHRALIARSIDELTDATLKAHAAF